MIYFLKKFIAEEALEIGWLSGLLFNSERRY